ncbi:MAG: MipA/OmpV family protein [Granulosicoccus sp.]
MTAVKATLLKSLRRQASVSCLQRNGHPSPTLLTQCNNALRQALGLMLGVLLILSGNVHAQGKQDTQAGLEVTVSAGVLSAPAYLGGDEYQTSVIPNVTLKYADRWSASLRGIRYVALSDNGWQAGPLLSYDFGREERIDDNPFAISSESSTDLIGLGDIDGTLELGGFVEYEARAFSAKLELIQGVDGGHDGLSGKASVSYRGQFNVLGPPAFYSIGPALSFGDDAYNSTFFDTSAAQSVASGISQYDADGGVNSIGLHSSVFMPLTRATSIVGFLQYDELTGDVAESSLVTERGTTNQVTTGLFLNYRF